MYIYLHQATNIERIFYIYVYVRIQDDQIRTSFSEMAYRPSILSVDSHQNRHLRSMLFGKLP